MNEANKQQKVQFLDFSNQEFRKRLAWNWAISEKQPLATGTWFEYSYAK